MRNPKFLKQPRFKVKLSKFHKESGKSVNQVHKDTGLNYNTIANWVKEDREAENIPNHLVQLIAYYGLDWRDPKVIEIIEATEPTEPDGSSGQFETLAAGGFVGQSSH